MAGPVVQSGALVFCPDCGQQVMQKEMIPVGLTADGVAYWCVQCARKHLRTADPG